MKKCILSILVILAMGSFFQLQGRSIWAKEDAQDKPVNLLENGDFEKDSAGPLGGKLPAGWARSYGDPSVLEIVEDVRPGSPGDNALKIGANEKLKRGGIFSRILPLDAKKPLQISLWLKDGGDMKSKRTPYVGIAWYDTNRKPIILVPKTKVNYTYLPVRKQADWQLVNRTLELFREDEKDGIKRYCSIPLGAAYFQVRVFVDNHPWPAWVDDVRAIQISPSTESESEPES